MNLVSINGVWVNLDQITWLQQLDNGECCINFAGGKPNYVIIPRLTVDQVATIIRMNLHGPQGGHSA